MISTAEIYSILATSEAAIVAAIIVLMLSIYLGVHRNSEGQVSRKRIVSIVGLSASAYTLMVLVSGELLFGISIDYQISTGFGSERVAWLFLMVLFQIVIGIIDEFVQDDLDRKRRQDHDV